MLKKLTLLLSLMLGLVLASPWLVGLVLRAQLQAALLSLPATDQLTLQVTSERSGWLHSELGIRLHGDAVGADASQPLALQLQLAHGPVLWHLADTPLAVMALEVRPAEPLVPGAAQNYSASAILRLRRGGRMHFNGIAGFAAYGGMHHLQWRLHWPTNTLRQGPQALLAELQGSVLIDLETRALLDSAWADLAREYQQQRWLRFSQGRALSYISLQPGWVDINGDVVPAANILPLAPPVP